MMPRKEQLGLARAYALQGDTAKTRLSHFQHGVVFRNPVFDFNVKLFCMDEDLFCFCGGRNIGESIVDSISLPSARLKIVSVLVRGLPNTSFVLSKDTRWCPTLLTIRYPAQAMAIFAAWSAAL